MTTTTISTLISSFGATITADYESQLTNISDQIRKLEEQLTQLHDLKAEIGKLAQASEGRKGVCRAALQQVWNAHTILQSDSDLTKEFWSAIDAIRDMEVITAELPGAASAAEETETNDTGNGYHGGDSTESLEEADAIEVVALRAEGYSLEAIATVADSDSNGNKEQDESSSVGTEETTTMEVEKLLSLSQLLAMSKPDLQALCRAFNERSAKLGDESNIYPTAPKYKKRELATALQEVGRITASDVNGILDREIFEIETETVDVALELGLKTAQDADIIPAEESTAGDSSEGIQEEKSSDTDSSDSKPIKVSNSTFGSLLSKGHLMKLKREQLATIADFLNSQTNGAPPAPYTNSSLKSDIAAQLTRRAQVTIAEANEALGEEVFEAVPSSTAEEEIAF